MASIETYSFQSGWFEDACFPAGSARAKLRRAGKRAALPNSAGADAEAGAGAGAGGATNVEGVGGATGPAPAIQIQCRDGSGIQLNGVLYGPACVHNPPCARSMSLVPEPRACANPLPVPNFTRVRGKGSCALLDTLGLGGSTRAARSRAAPGAKRTPGAERASNRARISSLPSGAQAAALARDDGPGVGRVEVRARAAGHAGVTWQEQAARQPSASGMEAVRSMLAKLRLEQYAPRFEEEGFDDLCAPPSCTGCPGLVALIACGTRSQAPRAHPAANRRTYLATLDSDSLKAVAEVVGMKKGHAWKFSGSTRSRGTSEIPGAN